MTRAISPRYLLLAFVLQVSPLSPATAQTPDRFLSQLDQARLDSLAALTAQKVRDARLAEKELKVLVLDFFRNSTGTSSQLGTTLADRFSESISDYSGAIQILDRTFLKSYLQKNWTTLEDFRSNEVCLAIARQLGATGAILGILTEKNNTILLTLHLEGLGAKENEDDIFPWRDRSVSFSVTDDLHTALFQPGPNYTRSADKIPEEPGIFAAGMNGVTQPQCVYCPGPDYSDAARALKSQGNVVLSVIVTAEGQVTGVYVLKGAPYGLTTQAISAAKSWRMKPGQKDGKPVPVRTQLEIGFRLN